MTAVPGSGAMFDGIAARYDLLNRVLSLGIDRRWRRRLVASLASAARVLDLATGTGDVAIAIARAHPGARVDALDPSAGMLAIAERKLRALGLCDRVRLHRGDAQRLPFADAHFTGVTMAFGIRNVPDRPRALAEIARVLTSGGTAAVLELGEPRPGLLGAMGRFHIHSLLPRIGAAVSGSREYRYLARSIERFPPPEEVCAMMTDAGLSEVTYEPLTLGACGLYFGKRR